MSKDTKTAGRRSRSSRDAEPSRLDSLTDRSRKLYEALQQILGWTSEWRDKGAQKVMQAIQKIAHDACVEDLLAEGDDLDNPEAGTLAEEALPEKTWDAENRATPSQGD